MKPGAVIVDVAIDQGGCFETSRPTTHADPTYLVDGIVHYCVSNMPGAVARTATYALNAATLPYVARPRRQGLEGGPEGRRRFTRRAQHLQWKRDPPPGGQRSGQEIPSRHHPTGLTGEFRAKGAGRVACARRGEKPVEQGVGKQAQQLGHHPHLPGNHGVSDPASMAFAKRTAAWSAGQQKRHGIGVNRRHRRLDVARRNGHHLDPAAVKFNPQTFQVGNHRGLGPL